MKKMMRASGAALLALFAALPAQAADFSFVGTLDDPNQALYFDFSVAALSDVTLRTYSYAGGTNAMGMAISSGGFDPILSLYNRTTGLRVGQNDDGGAANVPSDPSTGAYYDTYLRQELAAGDYTVAVSAYSNFCGAALSDPCNSGGSFRGRTQAFAFDVLNVAVATGPGATAPEPATWAMMVAGFGAVGAALRRRRRAAVSFA